MFDLKISGGTVVDGTGAPGRVADVGVRNGRIVAIGDLTEAAVDEVDARGLVVAPGFIDLHTHYDAQAFWDTTLSPSPLHGVTTVIGGNCGFTIAPLAPTTDTAVRADDADYLMRMLARVEGMPLESLQLGLPWDWTTTGSFLDRLDGTLMPNAGFLVGHSALRRVVMGAAATEREATADEVAQMQQLLRDGLAAGGLGFSSTWSPSHNDHLGHAVPSRCASRDELIALCSVVSEFPGTTLEFIPAVGQFSDDTFILMGEMSAAANRPLNWNLLQVYAQNWDLVQHQLRGSDLAAEAGGRVLALTLPDTFRLRLNFTSGFILDILQGWDALMALPVHRRIHPIHRQLGRLLAARDVQPAVEAARRTYHRRHRPRPR
jgi:N-acyl-D-aspartate/D-glutamate deacylase